MRCKVTGKALPAIWKHPELEGQLIAAYTRSSAANLVKTVTGKELNEKDFSRTGLFAWRVRILSTFEEQVRATVNQKDMKD